MRLGPLTLLLLLTGCGQPGEHPRAEPVPDGKHEYVGHWTGPGTVLDIDVDGTFRYELHDPQVSVVMAAPITRWTADGFEAQLGPMTTAFEVRSQPTIEGGEWSMVIGDRRLTREAAGQRVEAPATNPM